MEQRENTGKKKPGKKCDIITILIIIALIVAAAAIAACVVMTRQNSQSEDEYGEMASQYLMDDGSNSGMGDDSTEIPTGESSGQPVHTESGTDRTPVTSLIPQAPDVDFAGLQKKGKDIVAWISIPSLGIEYPVVQTDNNEDYLHVTAYGSRYYAGSIILEAVNSKAFTDANTILYGHNMSNGSMFGKLTTLHENTSREPIYIWICTPENKYLYRVISEYVTDMYSEAYRMFSSKDTPEDVAKWISGIAGKSSTSFDMPPAYIKRVLTLSTCTSASDRTRRVVQAVMIGRG